MKPTIPEWVYGEVSEGMATELHRTERLIRPPDEVMSPATLFGMTATRLSFARTLIRRMAQHRWHIELRVCDISPDSTGFMAYDIQAEDLHLSFGVFVYPPFPVGTQRLFRDTKTEFLAILLEGPIDMERFRRERAEFDSRVWRGRTDPAVYGWTVASRGTRTFDTVVDALVEGRQPDVATLDANGGYIIRNGGYYGNGRMGTRAWQSYARDRGPLSMPYHIDLLSLYMWRLVSLDLAEATAKARSDDAVALTPELRRHVGIGNSSGLGTVAALVRWPARLSAFILTRELAFAYVKGRPGPIEDGRVQHLARLLDNAAIAYDNAPEASADLVEPRASVSAALRRARKDLASIVVARSQDNEDLPWLRLTETVRGFGSLEAVEVVHALLIEMYPEVDELSLVTAAAMRRPLTADPGTTVGELRRTIEENFNWLLSEDLTPAGKREYFWYRSEENGENRRGERSIDVGVERETFVDVAGSVRRLYDFLEAVPPTTSVARFLLEDPEHALATTRVQLASQAPFSEIHASVCATDFLASAGIRCFLSVLGVELPTPHNGRWVRGLFFRAAPLPADLIAGDVDEGGIGSTSTWAEPHDVPNRVVLQEMAAS